MPKSARCRRASANFTEAELKKLKKDIEEELKKPENQMPKEFPPKNPWQRYRASC